MRFWYRIWIEAKPCSAKILKVLKSTINIKNWEKKCLRLNLESSSHIKKIVYCESFRISLWYFHCKNSSLREYRRNGRWKFKLSFYQKLQTARNLNCWKVFQNSFTTKKFDETLSDVISLNSFIGFYKMFSKP